MVSYVTDLVQRCQGGLIPLAEAKRGLDKMLMTAEGEWPKYKVAWGKLRDLQVVLLSTCVVIDVTPFLAKK